MGVEAAMSALGHQRTPAEPNSRSAFPPVSRHSKQARRAEFAAIAFVCLSAFDGGLEPRSFGRPPAFAIWGPQRTAQG